MKKTTFSIVLLCVFAALFASCKNNSAPVPAGPLPQSGEAAQKQPAPEQSQQPAQQTPPDENGVRNAVYDWLNLLNQKDINGHMAYYAPTLERYFDKTNVSQANIAADKSRAFADYDTLSINATNMLVSFFSPERARVEFDKSWNFLKNNGKRFHGTVRAELIMTNAYGGWKIVSEQDLSGGGKVEKPTPKAPPPPSPSDADVRSALYGWANTLSNMDFTGHVNYYAPIVERYFSKKNISREQIADDKSAAFAKFTAMNMTLSGIDVTMLSATRAQANLAKSWDFIRPDGSHFKGAVRQRIILDKGYGSWLIVSEQDL